MNRLLFLLSLAILMLSACKNEKAKDSEASNSIKKEKIKEVDLDLNEPNIKDIPVLRKCYTLDNGDTKAIMNLELEDSVVTGTLNFTGKNPRSGSVIGEFNDNILYLTYKYRSDNKTSVKELALLEDKDNFTLQLGSGELVNKDNIKTFKNKKDIEFDGMVFKKLDCEQVGV